LTVLDGELDCDTEALLQISKTNSSNQPNRIPISLTLSLWQVCAYPVSSCLRNIFSHLLRRQTERTNLGSESRGCSDFTTSRPEVAVKEKVSASISAGEGWLSSVSWRVFDRGRQVQDLVLTSP
jgi:hypothetical protein